MTLRADTVSQFPDSVFVNSRTIYAIYGPTAGETILASLETAAASNAIIKRAISWMEPADGGIDMRLASSQAMVDSLTGTIFTTDQAATLKGWGAVQVPKWPDLREPDDIIAARSLP